MTDKGSPQPKGLLAGEITTTDEDRAWSRDSVKYQQQFFEIPAPFECIDFGSSPDRRQIAKPGEYIAAL